jgi:hypothetical protein
MPEHEYEEEAIADPNADQPDVDPNPEPDDVDAETPAHPDETPE